MHRDVQDEQLAVDVQLGSSSKPAIRLRVDHIVLKEIVGELQQDVVVLLRFL